MASDLFDLPFEEDPDPPETPALDSSPSAGDPAGVRAAERSGAEAGASGGRVASRSRRVFTVTELTVNVRDVLEREFYEVWVEGELSNCRVWNTGHLYFTLKDASSQLRGVIFRSALRYLRFRPVDGLRVIARGRLSVYEPKGEYQLFCEHLEPQGFGALQLAFDQLKRRLQEEGLFDQSRKRPLPALPRKIGIVTSLDGAALRDIIKVLGRRHGNAHLIIRPARVQGEGAAGDLARGLRAISRVPGVDVVIVGRGGGAIEDLWAFNEEIVARAIASSRVPVISAVGHETDVTIADFVADLRAPTPSAAAEMVVAAKADFCIRIDRLRDRLRAASRARLHGLSRCVHALTARSAFAGLPAKVATRGRLADDLAHAAARLMRAGLGLKARRLQHLDHRLGLFDLGRRLAGLRTDLVSVEGRLAGAMAQRAHQADAQLRNSARRLEALSPLAVLGRGYAVCWNADRSRVVRDASSVLVGEGVRVTLAKGELACEVREKSPASDEMPRS